MREKWPSMNKEDTSSKKKNKPPLNKIKSDNCNTNNKLNKFWNQQLKKKKKEDKNI